MADINELDNNLVPEETPANVDLTDLATEPGGAWPKGWYPGDIIEGYLAGSFQFTTSDTESKKGDSRNLILCFRVKNGTEERTIFRQYNYRTSDFSASRIQAVKGARKELGRGKWPGREDLLRSSIALGELGQLQTATGVAPQFHPETHGIIAGLYVGKRVDVRLGIDEKEYNEVTALAPLGQGGKAKPKEKSATGTK